MITLHQLPTGLGLPVSVSPYCAKTELYLRLTDRAYETTTKGLRKAPTKLVPWLELEDGSMIHDSAAIIAKFEAEGPALDEGLSAEDAARGQAYVDKVQDALYFACLHARFAEPDGWGFQKAVIRQMVPGLVMPLAGPMIRKTQVDKCNRGGFVNYDAAVGLVEELADVLKNQDFILGDQIRTADCAVWSNLMQTAHTLAENPARAAARARPEILAYIDRVAARANLTLPQRN